MSEAKENRQWQLAKVPEGLPTDENVLLATVPIPELQEGEFLVKIHYISVDPYQRGAMRGAYGELSVLGSVLTGAGVGTVVKSLHPDYAVGDMAWSMTFGWQEYAVSKGDRVKKVSGEDKLSYYAGILGMPGATAYFGFLKVIEPEEGKTLFVSGASGAVGALVGQIGKDKGLKVIGSTSSQAKIDYCKGIGYDEVINYKAPGGGGLDRTVVSFGGEECDRKGVDTAKTKEQIVEELKEIAPDGIDYFFDNTGGPISDAVLTSMNSYGRVSICGQIARYNLKKDNELPYVAALPLILTKQLRIEGFIITQKFPDWTEAFDYYRKGIADGSIKVQEDITEGIENCFGAFLKLFSSQNFGKASVHVSDP